MARSRKLKARYGASEQGNFAVIDTIGVPHPYMIGPKHVAYASDFRGGILDALAGRLKLTSLERKFFRDLINSRG